MLFSPFPECSKAPLGEGVLFSELRYQQNKIFYSILSMTDFAMLFYSLCNFLIHKGRKKFFLSLKGTINCIFRLQKTAAKLLLFWNMQR